MPGITIRQDGSLTLSPHSEAEARKFREIARLALEHAPAVNAGALVIEIGVQFRQVAGFRAADARRFGPAPAGGRVLNLGPAGPGGKG